MKNKKLKLKQIACDEFDLYGLDEKMVRCGN